MSDAAVVRIFSEICGTIMVLCLIYFMWRYDR